MTTEADDFPAKLHRLEGLVREAQRLPDPAARALVADVVQALLDLHGAGLRRLLDHVADPGACAADDAVGGLLLLHDLHPLGPEDRVRQAVGQVVPGGGVELLGLDGGIARLRIDGREPSAAARRAIEDAVFARAPEVVAVEIEGWEESPDADATTRFALPVV